MTLLSYHIKGVPHNFIGSSSLKQSALLQLHPVLFLHNHRRISEDYFSL